MGKIKILSEEVINHIAAGEVVERPASVVKELIENSLDAGADEISVFIKQGGKNLIKVIDNGCGMDKEDALLSIKGHSTSKIYNTDDIANISTLGFRGEALPSIASISQMEIITLPNDTTKKNAVKISIAGGKIQNVQEVAANPGTIVIVKNIFYNLPARRKFLKSVRTELNHIINHIYRLALSHHNVSFNLIHNDKELFNYPKTIDSGQRIAEMFGKEFLMQELTEVHNENNIFQLTGYVAGYIEDDSKFAEYHYMFINGRYIQNKIIYHAIRKGYEPFAKKIRAYSKGKLPPYILFLNIPTYMADFNVSPTKIEVRFMSGMQVHSFIEDSISKALLEYQNKKYQELRKKVLRFQNEEKIDTKDNSSKKLQKAFSHTKDRKLFSSYKKDLQQIYQSNIFQKSSQEDEQIQKILAHSEEPSQKISEENIINPWQFHNTYIFVQIKDNVVIIDQHAAHERILYEKILARLEGEQGKSQKLLFPLVLDLPAHLSPIIQDLVAENINLFHQIGFRLKTFSGNSLIVEEIPYEIHDWHKGEVLIEILKQLQEEQKLGHNLKESLAKSYACKAAIKAGKKLSKKEIISLLNSLFATKNPFFCPHGRPVIIQIGLNELEKRFGRI
ncbi:MAG: DNA mismatch repair endonuclease MutL [Candidatus Cloacimonadota bacterium]|nr:MAG: DNA mismatch repair endonuclease MutL [Candidatus Cloacimonadota bacterium]